MTDQVYIQATPERRAKAGEFYRPRHIDRDTRAEADRILQAAEFLRERSQISEDQIAACNAFERYRLASTRGTIRMASMEGRTGLGTPAHQQRSEERRVGKECCR